MCKVAIGCKQPKVILQDRRDGGAADHDVQHGFQPDTSSNCSEGVNKLLLAAFKLA
jgi:hypothetical protein